MKKLIFLVAFICLGASALLVEETNQSVLTKMKIYWVEKTGMQSKTFVIKNEALVGEVRILIFPRKSGHNEELVLA